MFGLRAFGRTGEQPARAPALTAPANAPKGSPGPSLFGLKARQSGALPVKPPPMLGSDPSGLPPLPDPGAPVARVPSTKKDIERLFNTLEKKGRSGSSARPKGASRNRTGAHPRALKSSGAGWIVLGVGAVGVGVLALVAFLVFGRRPARVAQQDPVGAASAAPAPSASSREATTADDDLPRTRLLGDDERLKAMLAQVHGHGGKESPELRALMNEQAALAARALSGDCAGGNGGALCAAAAESTRDLWLDKAPPLIKRRQRDPNRRPSKWLQGLDLPGIPIEDDPRVQKFFEFYTENPSGRETFQSMLFRCGAYRDLIQSTLIKYGLPKDLLALVLAESSCAPLAKSPVGAAGLWQFMPATARAYHLHVKEGVVDERLNPFKSTDAGVRFLADLYAKLGSWDLVFASYNAGPFGMIARIERAGGGVGFWDLVDAEWLPDETSNYVPTIQALALILNNLQKLRFAGSQMRSPQLTADLEVPAGTRLGLVARAAATSTTTLRGLNLDIVGEQVPNIPGGFAVQVPKDVVWQARDTLKVLLAQKDDADLCVSPAFDWGRQQFTPEMAKACHRKLKSRVQAEAP